MELKKTRNILALGWSIYAMLYICGISFIDIPETNVRVIDTVLGFTLGTIVATIIAFYFGSSEGSSDKNEMLKHVSKPPNSTP
jgi:hypothetical protein